MNNHFQRFFTLVIVCLSHFVAFSQIKLEVTSVKYDTLRIATYNLLNYPGSDATTRNPYFRRVIHSMKPDILVVQEMISQSGVNTFLSSVLNYYQSGLYSTITFHDGDDTDNHIFYKSSKATSISASYIPTALRDIAEYVVRINSSSDTIRLYSVHLKASSGSSNEQLRLAEATILRNYLNNLPSGTKFMIMGDFNIYTSAESAFQKLITSEADNDGRAKDPINAVGSWNNNYSFRYIHTQSPRIRDFGGGSPGGMDDRFDMILPSYSSLDNNIITSSYTAYGNDGNHFNDSINRLPNTAVPDSVANGLHYAADHIPVYCDFKFEKSVSTFSLISPANLSTEQPTSGTIRWYSSINADVYDVYMDTNSSPITIIGVNQTDTIFTYNNLLENTTYRWKVVAKNGSKSITSSESPWTFKTLGQLPSTFLLSYPENNATGQPTSGTLFWNSSLYASNYDIYLDTISPPISIVASDLIDTLYNYSALNPGKTYYWKIIAKNGSGTIAASNSPRNFTTLNVPIAPTNIVTSNVTTTSAQINWTDNATNETGYKIYRTPILSEPFSQIGNDLPINTAEFIDTGLSINKKYFYRIVPFNNDGEGNYGEINITTLAATPGSPILLNVGYISTKLTIDTLSNPSSTQFAIQVLFDTIEKYVQGDGTIDLQPEWLDYFQWGGANGITVTGLYTCHQYQYRIKARNGENIETEFGPEAVDSTLCFDVANSLRSGWNLISVPVTTPSTNKSEIFPTSISNAFAYQRGYIAHQELYNGKGYWLKFSNEQPITIPGEPLLSDSIEVQKGWNIVGSISFSVSTDSITSIPNDLIISPFYGYNGSYFNASDINPMSGYWVKVNSAGKILLNSSAINFSKNVKNQNTIDEYIEHLNSFTFEDCAGHKQTLYIGKNVQSSIPELNYELPPIPPTGSFDVRFNSQLYVAIISDENGSNQSFPISIQCSSYPITVTQNIVNEDIEFYFENDQQNHIKSSESFVIKEGNTNHVLRAKTSNSKSIPKEFTLYQNYPNPFNPSTQIRFNIPNQSLVTLKVYNVIGEEIISIADNKLMDAGVHRYYLNASDISAGVYVYRLIAIENDGQIFSDIKKAILLK